MGKIIEILLEAIKDIAICLITIAGFYCMMNAIVQTTMR